MGGSNKGGGGKGFSGSGSAANVAPTVSQPPVSSAPLQNLSSIESQFVNAPWSEPGWQSNAQPQQQQYLDLEDFGSSSSTSSNQPQDTGLAQWLFGEG